MMSILVDSELTVLDFQAPSRPSTEASSFYLASKSNYQNMLEGTHLPGVSYPKTLVETLTSKRTSHKIAEHGRRTRMNLALKEIEALLPPSMLIANSKREMSPDAETDGGLASAVGVGAGQTLSKASTIEFATVYIQNLQNELQETKRKLEAAERRAGEAVAKESSAVSGLMPTESSTVWCGE
jgi:hypothetical protein